MKKISWRKLAALIFSLFIMCLNSRVSANSTQAITRSVIASFTPLSGTSGSTVTITGTNFTYATGVSFGGVAALSFHIVNATTLTAIVGTGMSGAISVVTSNGGTATSSSTFVVAGTISSFTPLVAAVGATVTITGVNLTNAIAVSFGGVMATSFVVVNSTTITAVVGAGASGVISVITSSNGTAKSSASFIPLSTITSFTTQPAVGGSIVTITGTNFTNATGVSFGGVAAVSFHIVNATIITALAKTGSSGIITVMTSSNGMATSLSGFIQQSTISSFTPLSAASGATVTITGTNLTNATAVSFGGIAAASFHVINSTTVMAVVGACASGAVTIVTQGSGTAISLISFKYSEVIPYAYIPNSDDNTVSVLNTLTNQVVALIPVGADPESVEITPDGKTIYIMNFSGSSISVLDGFSNTVTATIHTGNKPASALLSKTGMFLYVANEADNTVSVFNTATNTLVATIPVGNAPEALGITPDGKTLYVANCLSNTVSEVSTNTNHVVKTISTGNTPYAVCVSPDGMFVYIADFGSNSVSVISTLTNTVVASLPAGIKPAGIKLSLDGKTLYLANNGDNSIGVVNIASGIMVETAVGLQPQGLNLSTNGKTVYVVNNGSNTVSEVSTATNQVTATVIVGNGPVGTGNFIASHALPVFVHQPAFALEKKPELISSSCLFLVYPNPGQGLLSVGFNTTAAGKATILIFDINGRKVGQQTVASREANVRMLTGLDLSKNAGGIYLIEVLGADGKLIGQTKYVKAL